MFYALVAVCEALFWALLGGFALARYFWGRRRLSLVFLVGLVANELWLVPFAVGDAAANGRFTVFHADVLFEVAALPAVLLVWGRSLFGGLDRGAERYVAGARALSEAEGLALPMGLVAAAVRRSRGRDGSRPEASGRSPGEVAADLDRARNARRNWYAHLAVFLVGQGLIQVALVVGLLEPSDGLYFGNGPTPTVGIGPLQLTFDVAGLRRAWTVLLAADFLWSFSYSLWPRERGSEARGGGNGGAARLRVTGRGVLRGLLAATALGWAAFGLFWALLIVLPAPSLILWFLAVLVEGYSLLLAAFALLGLGLAALARRAGARRTSLVVGVLGATTVVLSLVPVAQGWRTASEEGVALSFAEYLSLPSFFAEGSPETVTYARPGERRGEAGEKLKLDVWRPPEGGGEAGSGRRPAVVVVHGGGWETGSRKDDPRWSQWFVERGYVVFDIDYRLAPPPRWRDATGDVKCAVGWVKENAGRYGVDPDRVGLVGNSAGAHLALLAAYTEDDPEMPPTCKVGDTGVAAVAALYPPTALMPLYETEYSWRYPDIYGAGGMERFMGGTPESVPYRYRLASPTSHVDNGDPPTFLVHGGADQIVPPGQSGLLEEELRERGVPHRYVELPGANHAFDFAWGGWDTQITRAELEGFVERRLARPGTTGHPPSHRERSGHLG